MRKLIIATLLLSVASPALADGRHRRSNNNEVGIMLGILGLGLGAAYIYNENQNVKQCEYYFLTDPNGRQLWDVHGNPIRKVVCH